MITLNSKFADCKADLKARFPAIRLKILSLFCHLGCISLSSLPDWTIYSRVSSRQQYNLIYYLDLRFSSWSKVHSCSLKPYKTAALQKTSLSNSPNWKGCCLVNVLLSFEMCSLTCPKLFHLLLILNLNLKLLFWKTWLPSCFEIHWLLLDLQILYIKKNQMLFYMVYRAVASRMPTNLNFFMFAKREDSKCWKAVMYSVGENTYIELCWNITSFHLLQQTISNSGQLDISWSCPSKQWSSNSSQ